MSELKKAIATPLTNVDLEKYIGSQEDNILKYEELDDYEDLEQLLPTHKSFKILLIEYENNSGHWICIMRYKKTIEIFNSFGVKYPALVGNKEYNKYLGQYALFLNQLVKKEQDENKFDIIYNKIQYQEKSKDVNTCGRHVMNRILCLLHNDMNLKQYQQFMNNSKKSTNFNYDELVATIIT
jgi:hypothetical protein